MKEFISLSLLAASAYAVFKNSSQVKENPSYTDAVEIDEPVLVSLYEKFKHHFDVDYADIKVNGFSKKSGLKLNLTVLKSPLEKKTLERLQKEFIEIVEKTVADVNPELKIVTNGFGVSSSYSKAIRPAIFYSVWLVEGK